MQRRHDDMAGMDETTTSSTTAAMSMSEMSMTFFSSTTTPLYATTWTPATIGAYAGTCVFLVFLAVIFRSLLALKSLQEARWLDKEFKRRYVVVAGKQPKSERISEESSSRRMVLTENGVEEEVMVVQKRGEMRRPWRFSVDPLRAVIDTIVVGVGYLLMLGVMTMNIGYFLSILGGTFLGSLVAGRFTAQTM
ncbi:Ctr copper transporter [Bisporella sp. PMI_857]|nr:Ctr copper transporter [Bisporella sp. PMI_857]